MRLEEFIGKQSKKALVLFCLVPAVIVGVIDYLTGPDVSLLILYVVPVLIAAWLMQKKDVVAASFIVASIWALVRLVHPATDLTLVLFWNGLMRLVLFVMLSFLVSGMKEVTLRLDREKTTARTDALTGIMNYRCFFELADMERKRTQRYKRPLTMVYMDIDNFKTINDTLGHTEGDNMLRIVAQTLHKSIRESDIVARLGGDEFVALFQEVDGQLAREIVGKIQKILLNLAHRNKWPTTFSFGVATFVDAPVSVDDMVKKADQLMYTAKNDGKNRIIYREYGREQEV
jgi:diguanylate cyclase (GGDEF)-like protein